MDTMSKTNEVIKMLEKASRKNYKCNRCEALVTQTNTYIGGYTAELCVDCQSELNLHLAQTTGFRRLWLINDARQSIYAQISFDGQSRTLDLTRLTDKQLQLERELFYMTENFVTKRIERETKEGGQNDR